MKTLGAASALMLIVLTGCGQSGPTKIDASTQQSLQDSISKVKSELSPDQQTKFGEAMVTLAMSDLTDAIQSKGLLGAASALPADPNAAFLEVSKYTNGKTADEIIAEADQLKADRIKKQVVSLQAQIAGLEQDIENGAKQLAAAQTVLAKMSVTGARFYFSSDGFMDQPTIDFSVTNQTGFPIKTGYFHGLLESTGRAIPWVDEDFNYEFRGGIENGETQHLMLSPNMFGNWGNADLKGRKDLVLTVTVLDVENAKGDRIANSSPADLDAKRKQLADLQAQLKALANS